MEPTSARVLLEKYGLAPSKERGQNFLVDPNIVAKVVEAVGPGADEVVLEIGPGLGAITFGLARRARHVVAVEHDSGLVRAFRKEHGDVGGVTLVHGDALQTDPAAVAREYGVEGVVLAGNLPYNLTSPAIRLAIGAAGSVLRAVFMIQTEVARRLVAEPATADYSALTATLSHHASVSVLFNVSRNCFYPKPAVDSSVVEIVPLPSKERSLDPELYSDVVHAAFGKRRKMLRQSLRDLADESGLRVEAVGEASGLDLKRRGETLSVEEFEKLTEAFDRLGAGGRSD